MLLHSMTVFPNTEIAELIKEFLLSASHVTLSQQVLLPPTYLLCDTSAVGIVQSSYKLQTQSPTW